MPRTVLSSPHRHDKVHTENNATMYTPIFCEIH